jgi:retron-type reverse transcriptase
VSSGLERVRERARREKKERFTTLLHHVDVDLLRNAFRWLKRDAAPGVDGLTWGEYEQDLESRLVDLHSLSHEWLMRFIQHRVGDPRIIRLIRKWLKAGVMVDGNWSATEAGSPQGAVVSPVLANIYLHYCFDLWAEQWRHRHARGHVLYVRFAGETFNFLGFTHICGQSRRGRFLLKRKTCRKRMRAKLKALKGELRRRMHAPIAVQGRWLAQVLRGYFGYFAVPTNYPQVAVAGGAQ